MDASGQEMRETVRRGVEQMRRRRKVVERVLRLAERAPEDAARGLIVLATKEHDRLRQGLQDRYGFTMVREANGYVCRFASGGPGTRHEKADWLDATVGLIGYERALVSMRTAAEYHQMDEGGRDRVVVNAFCDVYERTPAIYNAFAAYEGMDALVREHASAMAGAWARAYLKAFPGSKVGKVLNGEGWEDELVNAAALAWEHLGPDAPLRYGTRFRDSLPPTGESGRRRRANAPQDLVNATSAALEGNDITRQPQELELARFSERQLAKVRKTALERGREAGLPPREMQLVDVLASNPGITDKQAGKLLGIKKGTVGSMKRRIRSAGIAV